MKVSMKDFYSMVQEADDAGACEEAIERLREFKSLKEFSNHDKAPYWVFRYARYVLKGRFILGEEILAKDAAFAYYYAKFVLKGRFIAAEPIIAKIAFLSVNYAKNVVKGRFTLGERAIYGDYDYAKSYIAFLNTLDSI